jgi:hypothetical protein
VEGNGYDGKNALLSTKYVPILRECIENRDDFPITILMKDFVGLGFARSATSPSNETDCVGQADR